MSLEDTKKVLIALDYDSQDAALNFVKKLSPDTCRLKVGKEMFTYFGPAFVKQLIDLGFDVFLDLKFHDIPNTVAKAVTAAANMGVWMVNVHASGGFEMMNKAKQALEKFGDKAPLLIAVTVLTSMDEAELKRLGVEKSAQEQVIHLAKLTKEAGNSILMFFHDLENETYEEIEKSIANVRNEEKRFFKIASLPIGMKEKTSKKGNKYAYVQFSDNTANFEAIIFADLLKKSIELIQNHELLLLTLEVIKKDNNINLRVQEILTLRQFIKESNKKIKILTNEKINIAKLKNHLNKYKSNPGSEINLLVDINQKLVNISIPGRYDYFNIINNKMEDIKFLN